MKPEELRIGNWVKNEGGNIEVACYDLNHFESLKLKPIQLTEEWLERFGFVKNIEFDHWEKETKTGEVILSPHNEGLMLCSTDTLCVVDKVHHLQNLYYALTGEELKHLEG